MFGKLYLIPTTIGDSEIEKVIPVYNINVISKIRIFIVDCSQKQELRALPTLEILL